MRLSFDISERHLRKRHSGGFTIAELLIVVAIVGVLVAIAIPVFTASLESAKEATCMANRRSMYAEVVTTAMNSEKTELEVFKELDAKRADLGYSCPDNGTWTWNEASRKITCDEHPDEDDAHASLEKKLGDWLANTFPANTSYYDKTMKKLLEDAGIEGVSDRAFREYYAKINGKDSWDQIATDEDGNSLYLEFKSYSNDTGTIFYYAGKNPDPKKEDWKARYIYDTASESWYDLGKNTGLTGIDSEKYHSLISTADKVNLVDGKFVPAS